MEERFFSDRIELRSWLTQYAASEQGFWLVYTKSAQGGLLTYYDILEECLCFGWIDSKVGKVDELRTKIWVAPRNPKSNWSAYNKRKIEDLRARGLMTKQGEAAVEAAQAGGQWNALDEVDALIIPQDLHDALASFPEAQRNFDSFPRSVRRGILEWILSAKRPETRAQRITETARLAQDNIRANQWPRKG
jgi:uncharacterized protein YdeI (YjbR/CyaY-like superfamily)